MDALQQGVEEVAVLEDTYPEVVEEELLAAVAGEQYEQIEPLQVLLLIDPCPGELGEDDGILADEVDQQVVAQLRG